MNRTSLLTIVCLTILTFAGCAAAEKAALETQTEPQLIAPQAAAPDSRTRSGGGGNASPVVAEEAPREKVSLEQADKVKTQTVTRKIIRNANLTLEANQPEEAARKIGQIAESKSGFVVTSDTKAANSASGATSTRIDLTLRVPAEQFDAAIGEIRQTATRVAAEKVAGQDVTEEFIDLEARLSAKRALEAQFLEIMKRSSAVSDALEVQRELATVRGEIESLEGRRKFLENQTSLSTIQISLQTPHVFAASSNGFFYQIGRAFSEGIDAALGVVLFLITAFLALLPIIILLGVPLYLLFRYLRKRIRRQKLAQQFARDENADAKTV